MDRIAVVAVDRLADGDELLGRFTDHIEARRHVAAMRGVVNPVFYTVILSD